MNDPNRQSVNNYVYRKPRKETTENNNQYNHSENNDLYNNDTYHSPADNSYHGEYHQLPHDASPSSEPNVVEVPLPKKIKASDIILTLTGVIVILLLLVLSFMPMDYSVRIVVMPGLLGVAWAVMLILTIVSPFIKRGRLQKVCLTPVTGELVGYDSRLMSRRHRHRYSQRHKVYAPKYQIFINGRYEIRTLDDFTMSSKRPQEMELLANPKGYEIMPADRRISREGRNAIITSILFTIGLVILIFFVWTKFNGGFYG